MSDYGLEYVAPVDFGNMAKAVLPLLIWYTAQQLPQTSGSVVTAE